MKTLFLVPVSYALSATLMVWIGAHYDSYFAYFARFCMGVNSASYEISVKDIKPIKKDGGKKI